MNIVIVNAHWSNRGDEAAHRALWEKLRQKYPGCHITVMIKDRKSVSWFPDMENTTYFSCQFTATLEDIMTAVVSRGNVCEDLLLKKTVDTLKTADLIIYPPGGSVINDRFFWSKQLEYLVPFLCARNYNIPMIVAAPSMGPFDLENERPLRTWLLETPQVLCVREEISRAYLKEIGITENIRVAIDLAFMSDVNEQENAQKLESYSELKQFLATHKKVVGMTISDFKWHVKLGKNAALREDIEASFQQFISYLATQGYGVLLIPQLFGNQNDYDYLQKFIGDGADTFVMSEHYDTYFQQYVISQLHSVVGMRYHCNIFAAKMGTPFVAVSYEEKMAGFLELAGLTEYSIAVECVSLAVLKEKFDFLESKHADFKAVLLGKKTEWKKRAEGIVNYLPEL